LIFGEAGGYIYKRGKDPDNPDDGEPDQFGPIDKIKRNLDDLYANLDHLDTDYDMLESQFNNHI
jgi:hypothetical protein